MSLVRNERLKLTAGWLNALAAGIIIAGAVAPLVAAIYRGAQKDAERHVPGE